MVVEVDEELVACLKLNRWKGVSRKTKLIALEEYHSFSELCRLSSLDWLRINNRKLKSGIGLPAQEDVRQDLLWLEGSNRTFIAKTSKAYPKSLREIYDGPLGLYVLGDSSLISSTQIAIVGSRKQTPAGKKIATDFATGLSQLGITITSGLALGVDTSAHLACCLNDGPTIAVTGCGLDIMYPRQNTHLANQILEKGCIVSELPIGTKPLPHHFPERNRIISGLSLGVIVVEAAKRSGSLITARLANEQGKEVFAVPGSTLSPLSQGCHELIKQGANLACCVEDILHELDLSLHQSLTEMKSESKNENSMTKARKYERELNRYFSIRFRAIFG